MVVLTLKKLHGFGSGATSCKLESSNLAPGYGGGAVCGGHMYKVKACFNLNHFSSLDTES